MRDDFLPGLFAHTESAADDFEPFVSPSPHRATRDDGDAGADARRGDDGDDDAARRDDGDDAPDAARDARRETRARRTTRGGCGARWRTKRRDGTRDDDAGRRTNDARTIDVVR